METPVDQLPPLDEYQRRFVANMDWLRGVNRFSWADVQRKAGLSDRAVTGWRSPKGEPNPTLSSLASVAGVLGVEPGDMLLPEEELKVKVAREGLRPFVDPALVNRPVVSLED